MSSGVRFLFASFSSSSSRLSSHLISSLSIVHLKLRLLSFIVQKSHLQLLGVYVTVFLFSYGACIRWSLVALVFHAIANSSIIIAVLSVSDHSIVIFGHVNLLVVLWNISTEQSGKTATTAAAKPHEGNRFHRRQLHTIFYRHCHQFVVSSFLVRSLSLSISLESRKFFHMKSSDQF